MGASRDEVIVKFLCSMIIPLNCVSAFSIYKAMRALKLITVLFF